MKLSENNKSNLVEHSKLAKTIVSKEQTFADFRLSNSKS